MPDFEARSSFETVSNSSPLASRSQSALAASWLALILWAVMQSAAARADEAEHDAAVARELHALQGS